MATAERQRKFAASKRASGFVPIKVWLPRQAAAEFKIAAERIAAEPDLRIGRLVSARTGRVCALNT